MQNKSNGRLCKPGDKSARKAIEVWTKHQRLLQKNKKCHVSKSDKVGPARK